MRSVALTLVTLLCAPVAARAAEPRRPEARGPLLADEQVLVDLFARAAPSVVYVTLRSRHVREGGRDPARLPGGATAAMDVLSVASGVVWDKGGLVVTNHHVVAGQGDPWVTFGDGHDVPARVVAQAPEQDVAILAVDVPAERLVPIALGTSADLRVGQTVLAIGNPFGLDHTLTLGIVSALDREMGRGQRRLFGLIQTDAAINPGNPSTGTRVIA